MWSRVIVSLRFEEISGFGTQHQVQDTSWRCLWRRVLQLEPELLFKSSSFIWIFRSCRVLVTSSSLEKPVTQTILITGKTSYKGAFESSYILPTTLVCCLKLSILGRRQQKRHLVIQGIVFAVQLLVKEENIYLGLEGVRRPIS